MGKYVGVDWAGKRWIVVSDTGGIKIQAEPSIQAVWDKHEDANQILIDIPIGLPENPDETPRACDEQAREFVSGTNRSSIFDVPCRSAVQTSDWATAVELNENQIGDDSLGPQKWGFSERIYEADVFMRRTETNGKLRESHPEICYSALSPNDSTGSSKKSDEGLTDRISVLDHHEPKYVDAFQAMQDKIHSLPAWKRRIGIGMSDDILDSMVLAYTPKLGYEDEFSVLGGRSDAVGLPMEIVFHEGPRKGWR